MCLQEIKVRPEQLRDEQRTVPGYQAIWNPADRPGYSGVASLARAAVLEQGLGMDPPQFDVEGRHLLGICYELRSAGERLIITADFNAAQTLLDLKNPGQNRNTSGFLPVEREWVVDRLLSRL